MLSNIIMGVLAFLVAIFVLFILALHDFLKKMLPSEKGILKAFKRD